MHLSPTSKLGYLSFNSIWISGGSPKLRNAPPVAGAITWSRQLLKRIEDPMKVFRDNKAITHLKDFSRIVKIYNRLATALVTFESLWFTQWRNNIDLAREGLRATLFVTDPETKKIMVNADERSVFCVLSVCFF